MRTKPILYTCACLTLLALPAAAAAGVEQPNADQLLRQMSAKLAQSRSFSFNATREIDAALLEGRNLPENARIAVSVVRPNKLAAHATSKLGDRRLVFNGRALSLLDGKANTYAIVPMATSLDGLVNVLDEKYGFTPPLAEFAVSDLYGELRQQAHTVGYIGRAKLPGGFLGLGGVECHRLALKGKVADAELWMGVNDQLPRKLVATFHQEGRPQVRIVFCSWNLAKPVSASDFAFNPPKGAEKIEMWTTARMAAVSR